MNELNYRWTFTEIWDGRYQEFSTKWMTKTEAEMHSAQYEDNAKLVTREN